MRKTRWVSCALRLTCGCSIFVDPGYYEAVEVNDEFQCDVHKEQLIVRKSRVGSS